MKAVNPMFLIDFYKADHKSQYPKGTNLVYSNFTPRSSRVEGINHMVFFGLQYLVKEYLIRQFNEQFFKWIFMNAECIDYTKMWQKEAKKYYIAKYTCVDAKEQSTLDIRTTIACRRLLDVPDYIRTLYMRRLKLTRHDKILTVITLLEEV